MVLHTGDNHLVVATEIALGKRCRHKVDTLGGATGKNHLVAMTGIDKLLNLPAYLFIAFGGQGGQMVGTTMDIAIEMTIVSIEGLNDTQGLLSGSRIIEIDQRAAMHLGIKYRKL